MQPHKYSQTTIITNQISISLPQIKNTNNKYTILIVDDEPCTRMSIKLTLKRHNFSVFEAEDGIEALTIFKQNLRIIDCVISDITMPNMNGWETLHALRKISPQIPVILSSGFLQENVMNEHHTEIPQAFLQKPYEYSLLLETIETVIKKTKIQLPSHIINIQTQATI